ncbi:MAG: hypothetical protein HON90_13260 [Halobacteriovoraceae bacterium]|jgi:hypothetical protein|nr:hypothetical protein [Halobacteriovoraceae bacterium]
MLKTLFILSLFISIAALSQPLYTTKGDKGNAAIDGTDGVSPGAHGGHAIAPTDAQHSGPITLNIREVKDTDGKLRFKISSDMRNADGTIKGQFDHLFEVDQNGFILQDHTGLTKHVEEIKFDSSGATSHGGGDGGDGKKGPRGPNGNNATRWTNGESGGTGGSGGNAGLGTNPSQSGNAAKTNVNVPHDQTHLLMHLEEDSSGLMDGNIKGGAKTWPGKHGVPGQGGEGGSGGSSYSWTTTTNHTRSGSDGKTEHYTETHHHSNPGGSNGSRGPRGFAQNSILRDKPAGKNAQMAINITQANGEVTTYKNGRYDLSIVQDAEYKSAAAYNGIVDGIIEPDEMVSVKYTIRNTSDMPTPKRVAHLAVLDSQGVRSTDKTHIVDIPELKPGQTWVTESIYIKATSDIKLPVKGDATVEKGKLTPRVTQSGTGAPGDEKVYKRADRKTGFDIQQAAKLDDQVDIKGSRSLVPGSEETWVEIKLINNSNISAIGRDTDTPRQFSTRQQFLAVDGIGPDDIIVTNEAGNEISLKEELIAEHKKIPKGESKTLKLKIKIKPGMTPYSSGKLQTILNRGALNDLLGSQDIQVQDVEIQAVKLFDPHKKPDVILVTNSETSKEAVAAYKEKMKKLGKVVEDYNISYYSAFDIDKPPLSELDSKKTTIMVMNNEYGPETHQAGNRLKLGQTLDAVHNKKMKIMFLGPGSPGSDLATRLSPAVKKKEDLKVKKHASKNKFNKAQKKSKSQTSTIATDNADEIQVKQRFVYGKTNHKKLKKQAEAQKDHLNMIDPRGRYVVVRSKHNDGYKPTGNFWDDLMPGLRNFFSSRPVGSYTILRTSDIDDSGVSNLKVSQKTMNDPNFIKGYDFELAYIKQLDFEEKLDLLDNLKGTDELFKKDSALYNAIISDLAEEQAILRDSKDANPRKLKELSQYNFKNKINPATKKFDFFVELFSELNHLNIVSKKSMFNRLASHNKKHLKYFKKNSSLFKGSGQNNKDKFFDKVEARSDEKMTKLKEQRAENKVKIKAARHEQYKNLPWWKKPITVFLSDPELDGDKKNLQATLHPVESKTFLIESNRQRGFGIDIGRNIMPENVVTGEEVYAREQRSKANYDNKVDEKVAYESHQRKKSTGRAVAKSLTSGVNHDLNECILKALTGH